VKAVDLQLLHQRDGLVVLAVDFEPTQAEEHVEGRRLDHEVPIGHLTDVARRQEQVLAALALVGTERADVNEEALQEAHRVAEHPRRRLQDRRSITAEVEESQPVDRLGVRGQQQRLGVHHRLPDQDLLGRRRAKVPEPATCLDHRHRRDLGQVDLDRPVEHQLIQQRVSRLTGRVPVLKREVAEPGPHHLSADPAMTVGR
jgi:hypothetical protein